MISYKLPKIENDIAFNLDSYTAGDITLANGVLTIKDEAGSDAAVIRANDLLSFSYDAYAAGTANVVDVVLTNVSMIADSNYALTVYAPYVQSFFGGGQETGATYQTRTYVVGVDGTPTVDELGTLFAARINADANAYFTATYTAGSDTLAITAASASAGALVVNAPAGAVVSDAVAWVAPVGTLTEVTQYINPTSLTLSAYSRYVITYRKAIRHNAVTGLQVIKPVNVLFYIDDAEATGIALLTSILDGSYTPVADYLGCPAV